MEKVFKVDDYTIYDCDIQDRFILRMFRGTREEFNSYYLDKVGHLPEKDYLVYDNPEDVARVEHGKVDNNAEYYRGKVSAINKAQKHRREEYRYLSSKFN